MSLRINLKKEMLNTLNLKILVPYGMRQNQSKGKWTKFK